MSPDSPQVDPIEPVLPHRPATLEYERAAPMARPLKSSVSGVVAGFATGAVGAGLVCLGVIWIVGRFNDQSGEIYLSDGLAISLIGALFLAVVIAASLAIAIALAIIRWQSSSFLLFRPLRAAAIAGASYFLIPLAIVPVALTLGWDDASGEKQTRLLLLWLLLVPACCIFYFGNRATRPPRFVSTRSRSCR